MSRSLLPTALVSILYLCSAATGLMALEMLAGLIGVLMEIRAGWPLGGYLAIALGVVFASATFGLIRLARGLRSAQRSMH